MFRQGVSALIANIRNEFLVVNLVSFEPKFFAVPGGGVEPGETRKEAVYRELKEELNINKRSLLLIGKSDLPMMIEFKTIKYNDECKEFDGMERYFFGFRFIGKDSEIKPDKKEVRSYQWVSFPNLKDYLLFDCQLEETTGKIFEIFPNILSEN